MPRAFITGITGQDGQHLAEFLHSKGYQVFGMVKGQNNPRAHQIRDEFPYVELVPGDLADLSSLVAALEYSKPDEVYNLGAISFVPMSFGQTEDITVNYRESYDIFACSGILFNHEGPRRGLEFVTRKISNSAARIKLGLQDELVMGNLDAKRDWGYAGDYVRAMWLMLQQDQPDDYVVATGEMHSIEEFLTLAFAEAGLDDWHKYVRQDPKFFRPAEVDLLIGDPKKAQDKLGWVREVDFPTLVKMMVRHDLQWEESKLKK
ncbi:MAG: GDP-mannose 4,6-dehydratase [Actinobacteria bacterium]|nr:GDP-mannose 4,6-dehydratase [Actinomycetota bacterium]